MKIEQLIRERRTIHSYLHEEVPEATLAEALQLATCAPNHHLTFPFQFIHVMGKCRAKIADIAVELKSKKDPNISEIKKEAIFQKYNKEGSIVFFIQKLANDQMTVKEDYATMACAIQNFSLFLWSNGFGSKWSSGNLIRSPKTYGVLGIDPEYFEITGLVWAGKFKKNPTEPKRPKLEKFYKKLS